MALILCHSPKGGTGTTFLAAHIAKGLVNKGSQVTVLSASESDSLPLHFGLSPTQSLPSLEAPSVATVVAEGVDLRNSAVAANHPDFVPMLRDAGFLAPTTERVLIVDVPSGKQALADQLRPLASFYLCALATASDCISLLPQLYERLSEEDSRRIGFVLNNVDETRRLTRHTLAFLRQLAGPQLIGKIRHDEAVPEAMAMLQTLAFYAPSSAALGDLQAIIDEVSLRLDPDTQSAATAGDKVSQAS